MSGSGPILDRYRRLELLGAGGTAQVWLVEDALRPGALFALKELVEERPVSGDELRREFVLLSRLRHPALVEVYDLDRSPVTGLARFTLEYVEGETLAAAVAREGPRFLLEMAAEALRALAFLHDFGLVHRDLEPGNILVRERPRLGSRLVLLDVGLAEHDSGTAASGPVGTLPYLAPELFSGSPASPRSDLWALGAVLHEAVFGRPPHPFAAEPSTRFVELAARDRSPKLDLPEGHPPGLSAWLFDLLAPDPGERPVGAREALARLNAACGTSLPIDTAAHRAALLASDPPPARDAERRHLGSLLDLPAGPRVVFLTGPAGSGKSRLLRWLRSEAILRDFCVFAPPPQDLFSGEGEDGPSDLLNRMRREAAERPTLLLLDEVEAGGERLARMLDRIAREGKAPAVRVVAGLRPGEVADGTLRRLLADTGSVPTLHRVELPALDAAGLRALVERATGSKEVSETRLGSLIEASEGNPLLAEAMLVDEAGTSARGKRRSITLEQSVSSRLDLLSPHGLAWLQALVVIGADVPDALPARLAELPEAAARAAAEEVRRAGLSRVRRGRWSPESRWAREQVLSRIPAGRRAALHRRAAEIVLEEEGQQADAWRLARLYSEAGERDRAAEHAEAGAREAERAGEPAAAAERWTFALCHTARRDSRRFGLRARQAEALLAAGRYGPAARAFGAALRLCTTAALRADVLGRQAHALVQAGRFSRARAAAEQALALAAEKGLSRERARALKAIGLVLARLGREREALPLLEEALAIFHDEGDRASEAEALHNLAAARNRLQQAGAEADYLRAAALHRTLGQHASELKCLVGLARIHMRAGRLDSAEALLEDVRRKAADQGYLVLLENALSRLASCAIERGALDRALVLGEQALEQALHLGDRNRVMVNRCRLAEALIGCGRPAQAVELLRAALEEALEQVEPDMLDTARMLLANALIETPGAGEDDIALLLERSQEGFRQRRKARPLSMALVIEMERRARPGCREPFDPVRLEYEALSQERGVDVEPEMRVRAVLARSASLFERGQASASREAAEEAAELGRELGLPAHAARAQGLLGQALSKLGHAEPARAAFRAGAKLLDEAAARIEDPAVADSFIDRPVFRALRRPDSRTPSESDRRLLALYEMIRTLNSETDPEALLESILDMALRAVPAERGMILLRDGPGGDFSVRLARNLEKETEQDAAEFSRTIAAEAGSGRSILALDTGDDEQFRKLKSVSLYGIRSLMCVPLRSRGKIIGTVYLDSRRKNSVFGQDDLRFLEAFADHAALALENARERAELVRENLRLQDAAETRVRFGNMVGRSAAMQQVFQLIEKLAASELPVLIQGDSGTGKELVARAIHFNGLRRRKIFLSENCAAIPETLLESELFGHVRGAFTGADRERRGLFEQANGGTLFLDEVGDMAPAMQARLLRVLQEGEVRRVGADRPIWVDVRVLAATHRDLGREVQAGRFREDLFYRLQVLLIRLPQLRERPEDIDALIDHFLSRIARERGRPVPVLDPRARAVMQRYAWPGNVRQLENVLQRLTLVAGVGPIGLAELAAEEAFRAVVPLGAPSFSLEEGVREQLRRALAASGGNRDRAARLLGVSRATIYRKIRELGLN